MLGSTPLITFVPSTDLDRSRRFYADVIGLTVQEVTPFACVFRSGATMLRVTKVEMLWPQPFTILGWVVPDIHQVIKDLLAHGVTAERYDGMDQDHLGVWTTPTNDKIAWFKDPDDNTLSLTQFAHDAELASRR